MELTKKEKLKNGIEVQKRIIKRHKKRLETEDRPAYIKYIKRSIEWAEATIRAYEIESLIYDAEEHGEDTTLLKKELDDIKKKHIIF